ncbi:TRAP-type C4-dicarboxylate transport system, small permease component [Noviherbaspirillum humi]|uniref:TRAP transporter small permease protein n=1 Tax=Noviherbaspirillum humi TaxID=1688639 RepID=A0A239HTC6_9BURK|nr:TRAP transporter small permease [Noviherbaspirillum humi]SNS84522.1 TRAP-type C4-dicarboxylate transport system, small permease component [Noviherbaspirillum humi]
MNRLLDRYCRLMEAVSALFLAIMVLLVFSNVVLRYVLNTGITVAEEVSRWLFVWMTFMGAMVAMREHGHLGTDFLVGRLPAAGKKVCLVLGHLLMLYVTWLLFNGSLAQARINWDVAAPATGAPIAIFYASGVLFSVSTGVVLLLDLFRALTGRLSDDELVMIQESEEAAELEALLREQAKAKT